MEKSKKQQQQSGGLLETKSLASTLPEVPLERPKYVQILKNEKNGSTPSPQSTPSKSENSSIAAPATDTTPAQKPLMKKPGYRNPKSNNNNNMKGPMMTIGNKQVKVFLKKQQVIALPSDLPTREYLITSDNVVYFNGPNHYLSALYPVTIVVDGHNYNSVEHYYQACKLYVLVGEQTAATLQQFTTPMEVKKATKGILKENKVTKQKINEWKEKDSINVLKHVITHKFKQNEELKKRLLDTGDKLLIQTYLGDTYFAVGANTKYTSVWVTRHMNQCLKYPEAIAPENIKYLPLIANGKNVLGWILTQVREELRQESTA